MFECFANEMLAVLAYGAAVATLGASLLDCNDQGPWPCTVEGCPAPLMSCVLLADLDFCSSLFADIWEPAPPGTTDVLIHERCPHTCGRCGVASPPECNMPTLDASELGPAKLAEALGRADAPVVIRGATVNWPQYSYERLLAEHARVAVTAVLEGGTRRGEAARETELATGDFMPSMREVKHRSKI